MSLPSLLLVGAGAAGISAALWLHDLGIAFTWVDQDTACGGTLRRVGNPIPTLPGAPAANGPELVARLEAHLAHAELRPTLRARVRSLRRERALWFATLDAADGPPTESSYHAVILATGTRPRTLGLPAERTHADRGVEISVTRTRHRYEGAEVAVIGGGDAALEGALLLAEVCPRVHIVHRRTQFRGQRRFVEAVEATPQIQRWMPCSVESILTDDHGVVGLTLVDGPTLPCTGVFIRVGVEANLPLVTESVVGDDGYVLVDRNGRTPAHGLYACGDVTGSQHQSASAAMGDAARVVTSFAADFGYR
jgi:thioredoxin reductase